MWKWCLALVACSGASPDPGRTALLQVEGAQFRPGPFPGETGGPATDDVQTRHATIVTGRFDENLTGTLEPGAHAAIVGIAGEDGAWIVVAGSPQSDTPDLPAARALIGLAGEFPPGPFTLEMAAVDRAGRIGAPRPLDLVAVPEDPPAGELVIGVEWDGAADLDIHVVDALGGEAWSDHPNTFEPEPGTTPDPREFKKHGILDHDGNMDCHRDGHPSEHVAWVAARCLPDPGNAPCPPAPSGDYVVRVDAPSLCGDPSTPWFVTALRRLPDGTTELLGSSTGIATPDDVLQPRGRGAGGLALRFTL